MTFIFPNIVIHACFVMAQLKQDKLTPEMLFQNQKQFSEKLHKRALNAIKDISESYDKFEIKDDRDEMFLFNQVNYYYQDLTHIIFDLQQILIDIGKNTPSANNLEKVLAQLNVHTASIQESLKLEPKKLKTKLIDIVKKMGFQFEMLMKIITQNDLHEHKRTIIDCQLDFVIYMEKLKMNKQFCNTSFSELQNYIFERNENLISTLGEIKTGYEVFEEDFSHYVRRHMLHMQCPVDYMFQLRNSGRLTGNIILILKNTEKIGKIYIDEVEDAVHSVNPIQKLLVYFKNVHDLITRGTREMQKGLHEVDQQKFNIREILIYILVNSIHNFNSLNETVKDAVLKSKF